MMDDRKLERTITIQLFDRGGFDVTENGRTAEMLAWDEMLGTIAELTHPKIGEARYRMLTPGERAAERARHERIMDLNAAMPGWRDHRYSTGEPMYACDGTMLDKRGNRSDLR